MQSKDIFWLGVGLISFAVCAFCAVWAAIYHDLLRLYTNSIVTSGLACGDEVVVLGVAALILTVFSYCKTVGGKGLRQFVSFLDPTASIKDR
jgi:hypothetical protein